MPLINFLNSHKALLASVASALTAASGVVPPPYNAYLMAAAVVLAALSRGIVPPTSPTTA